LQKLSNREKINLIHELEKMISSLPFLKNRLTYNGPQVKFGGDRRRVSMSPAKKPTLK